MYDTPTLTVSEPAILGTSMTIVGWSVCIVMNVVCYSLLSYFFIVYYFFIFKYFIIN